MTMDRLMRYLCVFFVAFVLGLLVGAPAAHAQKLPGDAATLLPVLDDEITVFWPNLAYRPWLAAIPDQEANWKLKATLKTSREFGCGLGQFTKAYNANGTVRFDALEETKRLDKSLKGWTWSDCYNAQYQLRGLVLKMKVNDRSCSAVLVGDRNVKACAAASYNGGFGSVTKRIRTCRMTPGCQPDTWFGHLDTQCPQANVKVAGYGESFCMINSKYPGRVEARQYKFKGTWPNAPILSEPAKK